MNTSRKAMEWLICFSIVNLMLGCLLFHFPLLPQACACTTFLSFLSHIFYIFLNRSWFETSHVVFYTLFRLTCCIHLTHDLHSLQLFHTFYAYYFLGSSIFVFMLLLLMTCSCTAIIKTSAVLFKHAFLSPSHRSSLDLPVVCQINCPCNCFCVHSVFIPFFFLFLYSFVVSIFIVFNCACRN